MTVWLGILTCFVFVLVCAVSLVVKLLWEDVRSLSIAKRSFSTDLEYLEDRIDILQKALNITTENFSEFCGETANIIEAQAAAIRKLVQPTNQKDLN